MNNNTKRKLKQTIKLIKYFHETGQIKCDYNKMLEESAESSRIISRLKRTTLLTRPLNLQILIQLQKVIGFY